MLSGWDESHAMLKTDDKHQRGILNKFVVVLTDRLGLSVVDQPTRQHAKAIKCTHVRTESV